MESEQLVSLCGRLVDEIAEIQSRLIPADEPPREELVYLRSGLESGLEQYDSLPSFRDAIDSLNGVFDSSTFESLCAALDVSGMGNVTQSLRTHADRCKSDARKSIENLLAAGHHAVRSANTVCLEFVKSELDPSQCDEYLIDAQNLERGVTKDRKPIGGDTHRRVALAVEISKGPPAIFTLSLPGFGSEDSASWIAEQFWSSLMSGDRSIAKVRHAMHRRIAVPLRDIENLRWEKGDPSTGGGVSDQVAEQIPADERTATDQNGTPWTMGRMGLRLNRHRSTLREIAKAAGVPPRTRGQPFTVGDLRAMVQTMLARSTNQWPDCAAELERLIDECP